LIFGLFLNEIRQFGRLLTARLSWHKGLRYEITHVIGIFKKKYKINMARTFFGGFWFARSIAPKRVFCTIV
jgi:hypothetical protein